MGSVQRQAGVAGTFSYITNAPAAQAPTMTIYSDAARSVVAVASAALVATGDPLVWTASYPASLAPGVYYPTFSTILTIGQPAQIDQNNTLVMIGESGVVQAAQAPSYCSVAQLRSFGLAGSAGTAVTDADAATAILYASRIIDQYTGAQFWQTTESIVLNDVRLPLVRLPKLPIAAIAAVYINNSLLGSTAYTIEKWGLRLYLPGIIDIDGYPRKPYTSVYERSLGARFGQQITVLGTFGWTSAEYAIGMPLNRAAVLLAARVATEGVSSLIPDSRLKTLNVEGFNRSWDHKLGDETLDTTGDSQVDRLVRYYRAEAIQVA